ncbi:hypothetical protein BaRGS_00007921, partial [Batillaria attramentaria]
MDSTGTDSDSTNFRNAQNRKRVHREGQAYQGKVKGIKRRTKRNATRSTTLDHCYRTRYSGHPRSQTVTNRTRVYRERLGQAGTEQDIGTANLRQAATRLTVTVHSDSRQNRQEGGQTRNCCPHYGTTCVWARKPCTYKRPKRQEDRPRDYCPRSELGTFLMVAATPSLYNGPKTDKKGGQTRIMLPQKKYRPEGNLGSFAGDYNAILVQRIVTEKKETDQKRLPLGTFARDYNAILVQRIVTEKKETYQKMLPQEKT